MFANATGAVVAGSVVGARRDGCQGRNIGAQAPGEAAAPFRHLRVARVIAHLVRNAGRNVQEVALSEPEDPSGQVDRESAGLPAADLTSDRRTAKARKTAQALVFRGLGGWRLMRGETEPV